MSQQLSLPLSIDARVNFDIEDMRLLLHAIPSAQALTLLARCRDDASSEDRQVLAALTAELLKGLHEGRARRLLLWVLGGLHQSVDNLPAAADAYHAAISGVDEEARYGLVLACSKARALCLSRLGVHTEAVAEYGRYRRLAARIPAAHRARLEEELGGLQDDHWLFEQSAESWGNAAIHYRTCGLLRKAAFCEVQRGEDLMLSGRFRAAARVLAQARRTYARWDDEEGVTRADEVLMELFEYWRKPRLELSAARRAYSGLVAQEDAHAAAFALERCAFASATLGLTSQRDEYLERSIQLLGGLASGSEGRLARLYERSQAEVRLEYARFLSRDGRFPEALSQAATGVERLGSLRVLNRWRLVGFFRAIGYARENLGMRPHGSVPYTAEAAPPAGASLLPVDSPWLLVYLGQTLQWN
jgi:hypothetical protein